MVTVTRLNVQSQFERCRLEKVRFFLVFVVCFDTAVAVMFHMSAVFLTPERETKRPPAGGHQCLELTKISLSLQYYLNVWGICPEGT